MAAAKALAADARRGQRPAELGVIEAQLAAARAVLNEAEKTSLTRVRPLYGGRRGLEGVSSTQRWRRATRRGPMCAAIEKQLQVAKLGARADQATRREERVRQAEAGLSALRGAAGRPVAQRRRRPGGSRTCSSSMGEWVPANQPVLSMIPQDRVRLRFFVPQADVATLRGRPRGALLVRWLRAGPDGEDLLRLAAAGIHPAGDLQPRGARPDGVPGRGAASERLKGLTPGLPIDVQPLKAAAAQ